MTTRDAATATTYEPHAGPITLDTLDDLLASRRAFFGGFTMKGDDDEQVDDPADDDAEGDDDEADDDDDGEEYEPPTKAEFAKMKAALTKANAEAKKRRLAAKEKDEKPKPKRERDDEDDDADERRASETEAKWKNRVVKQAARAALAEAGVDNPARLVGLVDVTGVEVDDDGEVDGIDDEIDRLREDYPELFKRRRAGRVETGDRSAGKGQRKPLSATERQAAAILGKK